MQEEKMLSLLGSGFSPKIVASAVGCSQSYISQLLADADFSAKLAERKMEVLAGEKSRNDLLVGIENALLVKMKDNVDQLYKPSDIIGWFDRVHSALVTDKKITGAVAQQVQHNQIINITLPTFLEQEISAASFKVNAINQVIAVGAVPMITIATAKLLASLKENSNDSTSSTLVSATEKNTAGSDADFAVIEGLYSEVS